MVQILQGKDSTSVGVYIYHHGFDGAVVPGVAECEIVSRDLHGPPYDDEKLYHHILLGLQNGNAMVTFGL